MRKPEIWILFADAARARVVRKPEYLHDIHHTPLETVFEAHDNPRPLREIMADKPGRSFSSTGARRSAMAYHSDPVREQMRQFAASLLSSLETRFSAGDFEQLVICAPPRMLDALREAMPDALAASIRSQFARNYTKLAEIELRELLPRLTGAPE